VIIYLICVCACAQGISETSVQTLGGELYTAKLYKYIKFHINVSPQSGNVDVIGNGPTSVLRGST
jgi:hypothetical protein